MKKHSNIKVWGLVGLAMLTLAGCTPDVHQNQFSFNATMEQLVNADNNGSKVQLVNEQWTYWEMYDSISLVSNASTQSNGKCDLYTAWLVDGGGGDYSDYNGVFISTLTENDNETSQYFAAIHPANYRKHKITYSSGLDELSRKHGFAAWAYLTPIQQYRHDSSYAHQLLPMVAVYDGPEWNASNPDPYRLDFHSLAGLVRLQLVNGTGNNTNITKIELTSLDFNVAPDTYDGTAKRPLCGRFKIENLYKFNAFLSPTSFETPTSLKINGSDPEEGDGYTLTLDMSQANGGKLAFNANDLKSFYVVLPAFHGMDSTTYYHLRMTVYTDANTKCSKDFTVATRRNGITYMRAINIKAFNASTGDGDPVLVGNGTKTRPFKIYTYADLKYVRDQFNNPDGGHVYINGQQVTEGTYFRIMRSDIVLAGPKWTSGINNFTGHLTYYTNAPGTPGTTVHGITNRSPYPLFTNITAQGHVSDLNIICDTVISITSNDIVNAHYSPLCYTNAGEITDCRIISPSSMTDDNKRFLGKGGDYKSCFSGICVINSGTITGSSCAVTRVLSNNSNFAGICHQNTGTITGCIASSPMAVTGATEAGGICYQNQSIIADCYCDFHYTSGNTNWGGIVYENMQGLNTVIRNCYISANAIIHSFGNVGGIVCINRGLVNSCHAERGSLRGAIVGGIASTVNAGEVRNCYANDSSMVISLYNKPAAEHYAGGIVGKLAGGTVKNCFAVLDHITIGFDDANGRIGAVIGYLNSGTVNNCYGFLTSVSTPLFYGDRYESNGILTNCFLVKGSQTDVTHVDANDASLATLCTTLKELHTSNSDYSDWQRDEVNPNANARTPYLVNSTVSSKQRRYR